MLAGMFKAPTRYAPHVNLAASRARANEVLTNMVEAGFMSEGQVYGARMNPAKIVERGDSNTPDYFLDWAFEEVQRLMARQGRPHRRRPHHRRSRPAEERPRTRSVDTHQAIRQVPQFRQRRLGLDGDRRRGARHGRRQGLRRKPVQPRDPRLPPARLLVQGLRLSHRARERLHAEIVGQRRSGQLRPLGAEELFGRLPGPHDAAHGAGQVDQHHRRQAFASGRAREGARQPGQDRHQASEEDLLARARRQRHDAARAYRRLRRPSPPAASKSAPTPSRRSDALGRRAHLQSRARRAAAQADLRAQGDRSS